MATLPPTRTTGIDGRGENQTPGLPRGSALAPFRLSETTRLGATAAMKPRSPSEQKRKKKALPGDRKKRGRGASAVAKRRAEVLAVTRKMPRDHVSPSKKRTFHRAQQSRTRGLVSRMGSRSTTEVSNPVRSRDFHSWRLLSLSRVWLGSKNFTSRREKAGHFSSWAEDSIAGGEPSLPLGAPVAPIGIFATTTEKTPCRAVFPTEPFAGKKRTGTGIDQCCHLPNHSLWSLHIGKAIRLSWIAG